MKKALVFEGQIVQIEAVSFPVAPELIWVDVADDVSMETHVFDGAAAVLKPRPPAPTYAQKRAAEYPPATDYLDGIVKGDAAQVQAYVDACLAVKAKYPKT
jgi:hypothetical protein